MWNDFFYSASNVGRGKDDNGYFQPGLEGFDMVSIGRRSSTHMKLGRAQITTIGSLQPSSRSNPMQTILVSQARRLNSRIPSGL